MKCGVPMQIMWSIFHRPTLATKKLSWASGEAQPALLLCLRSCTWPRHALHAGAPWALAEDPGCFAHTHGRPKYFSSLWGPLGRAPWAIYLRHCHLAINLVCSAAVVMTRVWGPSGQSSWSPGPGWPQAARGAISMDADLPGDPFPLLKGLDLASQGQDRPGPIFQPYTWGHWRDCSKRAWEGNLINLMAAHGKASSPKLRPWKGRSSWVLLDFKLTDSFLNSKIRVDFGEAGHILWWLPGTRQRQHGRKCRRRPSSWQPRGQPASAPPPGPTRATKCQEGWGRAGERPTPLV